MWISIKGWTHVYLMICVAAGLKDFSNYLLYNFNDEPVDLYKRLRINVELCDELNVGIYSFPMKYHPLRKNDGDSEDFSHNRDYIGKHWNRKYIRAIQAILNSTKGKVGRGLSFFEKAFGKSEEEYMELLEMPETMLIYRFFFEWLDKQGHKGVNSWRREWKKCMASLDAADKENVLTVIHSNKTIDAKLTASVVSEARELLSYYTNFRNDIIAPDSELYKLKKVYDANPTFTLRRH